MNFPAADKKHLMKALAEQATIWSAYGAFWRAPGAPQNASAALAVPLLRRTPPRTVMLIGTIALLTGVATTLLATTTGSEALFLTGTAIAGVWFGGAFQGAIRTIAPLAEPHERAGVLSTIYLASYVALGLPAILAGVLVVHGGRILTTSREYSATIVLLAAFSLHAGVYCRGLQGFVADVVPGIIPGTSGAPVSGAPLSWGQECPEGVNGRT